MSRVLHHQSSVVFVGTLLLVLYGFWPTYFSRLTNHDVYLHAHALSMSLWCLVLVVQASAVRGTWRRLHRYVGVASPIVVSMMLVSTVALMNRRMQGLEIQEWHLIATAFNFTTLAAFLLLYGAAMWNRATPDVHAGYMLCTAFPFFTAFVPRLIQDSKTLVDISMAAFGRFAAIGQAALIPADLAALALSVWDWRSNRRLLVFPLAMASLLAIHAATFTLHRLAFWESAVRWFVA